MAFSLYRRCDVAARRRTTIFGLEIVEARGTRPDFFVVIFTAQHAPINEMLFLF
jgi:hypothetical protein